MTWELPHTFNFARSTQENYSRPCVAETDLDRAANPDEYFGAFKQIRCQLDHAFHGIYSRKRQVLQDGILSDVVSQGTCSHERPWIVFTAGVMGAGKRHVLEWMRGEGHFPLKGLVRIDPNRIGYNANNVNDSK